MARFLVAAFTIFSRLLFTAAFLWATGFLRFNKSDKSDRSRFNPFQFMKSKAEAAEKVEETFDSVAGADEAKQELWEIVDFLKHP